jgi:single-strand DNA-binding protein
VNETFATLVGNVATDLRSATSQAGVPITSFRLASTTRRFERGKGWSDVDTLYVTVIAWRALAENVAASFAKGDPIVVSGRLRVRQWSADDGRSGTAVELEAHAAGHDLQRGVSRFERVRPREQDRHDRSDADRLAEAVAQEPLEDLRPDADPGRPPQVDLPAAPAVPTAPDGVVETAPARVRARGGAAA